MGGGWRWMARRQLDGDGWQWTVQQRLECNGRIDGNGRRWTAHRRRWTVGVAMDSNGQRDSHSMAMDSMDGEGLLDGDSTRMDNKEWRECDGDGPRVQR